MTDEVFAHSLTGRPEADWEPLAEHLTRVGGLAEGFAAAFGWGPMARAAGLLHDIGKMSDAYQRYIRGGDGTGGSARGPDHSTAGARAACARYGVAGRLIGFGVAGHHGGLPDGAGEGRGGRTLAERLDAGHAIEPHGGWEAHARGLPETAELRGLPRPATNLHAAGFETAFLIRMLFSCLVDADSLATEAFYARHEGGDPPARGGALRPEHLARARAFTGQPRRATPVNALRAEILRHAIAKAALPPGLFTLTVPTGGGKTLTSLRFALEHAAAHGLRRVVYVIPFTSVVEQTAAVFRDALGDDADVLEHHASFDWDQAAPAAENDREGEGRSGLAKLRRSAENWDAPVIVTTAVQFFESLFANRRGRARKLHNLARSVVVVDEAQTLPVPLLRPCMAALEELARNHGASVVLCTATQPALRTVDAALPAGVPGFGIDDARELAPRPRGLYEELRRVRVEWRRGATTDAEVAARFAEQPRMLCIVNSRAHARALFDAVRDMPGARHLSTLMCAAHRRRVLADVRDDLAQGRPARVVSTSLIEAGVDVDFPEVWRAEAGLDSIAQAAGRCNREGRLDGLGRAVVFEPAEAKTPPALRLFWEAARGVLRGSADPLGLDAVAAYFRELYFRKGAAALDAATLDGAPFPILAAVADSARGLEFPFARIADAFRLIDEAMEPVLVPFDADAEDALRELERAERPPAGALRRLQQHSVPVPAAARRALLATGAAQAVRSADYGDRFVRLAEMSLYDAATGLSWADPTFRTAESNIVG